MVVMCTLHAVYSVKLKPKLTEGTFLCKDILAYVLFGTLDLIQRLIVLCHSNLNKATWIVSAAGQSG